MKNKTLTFRKIVAFNNIEEDADLATEYQASSVSGLKEQIVGSLDSILAVVRSHPSGMEANVRVVV